MAIQRRKISMDGNTAAAHVSYAFTEVAAIYPITPSSPMAEVTDTWSATDKNIFGEPASWRDCLKGKVTFHTNRREQAPALR